MKIDRTNLKVSKEAHASTLFSPCLGLLFSIKWIVGKQVTSSMELIIYDDKAKEDEEEEREYEQQ